MVREKLKCSEVRLPSACCLSVAAGEVDSIEQVANAYCEVANCGTGSWSTASEISFVLHLKSWLLISLSPLYLPIFDSIDLYVPKLNVCCKMKSDLIEMSLSLRHEVRPWVLNYWLGTCRLIKECCSRCKWVLCLQRAATNSNRSCLWLNCFCLSEGANLYEFEFESVDSWDLFI